MTPRCLGWIPRFTALLASWTFLLLVASPPIPAQSNDWSRLAIRTSDPDGLLRLDSVGTSNRVYDLLSSTDMADW